jgi:hypothetical protein
MYYLQNTKRVAAPLRFIKTLKEKTIATVIVIAYNSAISVLYSTELTEGMIP